jgi:hypothetical protein
MVTKNKSKSKAMGKSNCKRFDQIPKWAEPVLHGLSYWIGHQRAYFSDYPLLEGAITAEMCSLVNSKIEHSIDGYLYCEVMYKHLTGFEDPDQRRADILIAKTEKFLPNVERKDLAGTVTTVIEVKRGNVAKTEVTKDLQRLAHIKFLKPSVRAFLIIVSEGKLPNQYDWFAESEDDVVASRRAIKIEAKNAVCKVRRVCKVTSSLRTQKTFHSAILIEVENDD